MATVITEGNASLVDQSTPLLDKLPLTEFFSDHFQPATLARAKRGTVTAFQRALQRFRHFLERDPILTDLTEKNCNRFEAWCKERKFANGTGQNGHCCLVKVWRFAYETGALDNCPRLRRRGPSPSARFLTELPKRGTLGESSPLVEFVRRYAVERGLTPRSARDLRHVVRRFGKSLGRIPRLADLTDDSVNRWLVLMQDEGLAPQTVRTRRIAILVLWRAAVDADLVERPPHRIRKVKVPEKLPSAWNHDEMRKLLAATEKLTGKLYSTGVSRAAFWRAWILVAYYTGLRRSDMLRIRFEDIGPDGRLFVVQHKTSNLVKCQLPPDAKEAVMGTMPPRRRLIFGGVLGPSRLWKEFSEVVRAARLRGSTKKLRATGATWCEAKAPGSAMRFLGHRTPGLAYKHYVDPRFIDDERATPPTLTLPAKRKGGAA